MSEVQFIDNPDVRQPGRINNQCPTCERWFSFIASFTHRKFCSRDCYLKHRSGEDMIGKEIGFLTVVSLAEPGADHKTRYNCHCKCGRDTVKYRYHLKRGQQSCGECLLACKLVTHGHCIGRKRPPEYRVWKNMNSRCHDPKNKHFRNYGGRGIFVCDEWRHNFDAFFRHIGKRPRSDYEVDRIDNSKGYEPDNMRWTTKSQNGRNRRNTRRVTAFGLTLCLSEWAERTGFNDKLIWGRIGRGWEPERALTAPIRGSDRRSLVNSNLAGNLDEDDEDLAELVFEA